MNPTFPFCVTFLCVKAGANDKTNPATEQPPQWKKQPRGVMAAAKSLILQARPSTPYRYNSELSILYYNSRPWLPKHLPGILSVGAILVPAIS